MIVMVPIVKRVGSAFDVATMTSAAVVGTVLGAVNLPFWSTVPHAGLHVASDG